MRPLFYNFARSRLNVQITLYKVTIDGYSLLKIVDEYYTFSKIFGLLRLNMAKHCS